MSYKTTDQILQTVFGLLSGISVKKYLVTRPVTVTDSEFIVINSLPINAEVMQKAYINVNYHVKDLAEGIPNMARISAGTAAVLTTLQKVTGTNYLIDFESQEIFREEGQKEHFNNLRFSFKNINN